MENAPDFGRRVYDSLANIVVQSSRDVDFGISQACGQIDGIKYTISEYPADVSVWDRRAIQVIGGGPEKFLRFAVDQEGNVLEGKIPQDIFNRIDKFNYYF